MTILAPALLAMATSVVVAPLVLAVLRRGDVLDYPSERSSHITPVPRGGGTAVAAGALVGLGLSRSAVGGEGWTLALAAVLFGFVGLLEDVIGIRALHRLAIQFVAASFAALVLLDDIQGSGMWMGIVAVAAVFWLVAFVNAYNFMDGIDGISVAQALAAGLAWLFVGTNADIPELAIGGAIGAGAALGFAPSNVPRARMFLGDVGSYFLGAWLAALAVLGLRAGVAVEAVVSPLVLYAADTGTTLFRRVIHGERWYLPHRDHAYQRLVDRGWSHLQVSGFVFACICACGALGAVSLGGSLPARVMADAAILGVVAAYLMAPRWLATKTARVAVT